MTIYLRNTEGLLRISKSNAEGNEVQFEIRLLLIAKSTSNCRTSTKSGD